MSTNPFYEIDLTGPDGNAYVLLATAVGLARKFGYDEDALMGEMKSGDYEHLLKLFEGYFGDRVTMYRLNINTYINIIIVDTE